MSAVVLSRLTPGSAWILFSLPTWKWSRNSNTKVSEFQIHVNQNAKAEILICDNEKGPLRWVKYDPRMDMDSCVPYGSISSGETAYVGRTFARQPTEQRTYGLIPSLFVPSDGFITVYLGGLFHSSDVQILCVEESS